MSVSLAADGTVKASVIGSTQIVDGSIVSADISATAAIAKTQLASTVQTSLGHAGSALQSVPDASTSSKGAVQLAGDLAGMAAAPTVSMKETVFATPAAQTTSFTAVINVFHLVDATSGTITVTLPTSTLYQSIVIKKTDSSTNLVNISGTINGSSGATLPLRRQSQSKRLYADNSGGWNIMLGDIDLATLNATTALQGLFHEGGSHRLSAMIDGSPDITAVRYHELSDAFIAIDGFIRKLHSQ